MQVQVWTKMWVGLASVDAGVSSRVSAYVLDWERFPRCCLAQMAEMMRLSAEIENTNDEADSADADGDVSHTWVSESHLGS